MISYDEYPTAASGRLSALQTGGMRAIWIGALVAMTACSPAVAPSTEATTAGAVASASPAAWPPALRACAPGTFTATFRNHPVRVHIPAGHSAPLPAVIVLHGSDDDGPGIQKQSGMDAVADREGFMTLYPTARSGDWRFTSAGTDFVNALADDVPCTERSRTYLTGFSRGSAMAFHVACSPEPRRFAAFGGVAFPDYRRRCSRAVPAPWIYLHGTKDKTLNYRKGYTLSSGRQTPGAKSAMRSWARHNRCTVGPTIRRFSDVTLRKWSRCDDRASVVFYTIRGGDHQWPFKSRPSADQLEPGQSWAAVGASEAMWNFFSKHALSRT